MKLMRRGAAKNADMLREAKELLTTVCDESTIEEHWLFANTYHERTLVGRLATVGSVVESAVDVSRVVQSRQRGFHVIIYGVPDAIEAIKVLRLCHVSGVTAVHLVPGQDDGHDDIDSMRAVERAGEQLLLRVTQHPSLNSCLKSFPDGVLSRVISVVDDGVDIGCGCDGTPPTPVHAVDLVGGVDAAVPELCLFFCAAAAADVMEAVPTAVRVVVPTAGLRQYATPSVVTGSVLWEAGRQRVLSGTDYRLTEAAQKAETKFLLTLVQPQE
jgi:hypothetical protein